jgi:para-aminobenzoate synthetase component 1
MLAMELDGNNQPLDWAFEPLEALRRWPSDRRVAMLHSGRAHARWARWSILAEPTGTYRFCADGKSLCDVDDKLRFTDKPFTNLRRLLAAHDGPWIGYLGYDLGRWIETLPSDARDDRGWPIIELGYCPGYLAYDNIHQQWHACGAWRGGGYPRLHELDAHDQPFGASRLRSAFTRDQYESAVNKAIEYIAAGDIFQVNLSQRLTADLEGQLPAAARSAFVKLATVSPAWYGAYLETHDGRAIASTSPELFLEMDRDRRIVTRPIKGTRPAHALPEELRDSMKDTAELNMIVDLLRNDLGRVCSYGSVKVTEPRVIESHPTVHHGVATIEGRLHGDRDVVSLLRATMPGGSITGAPKVRAMQIIEELERTRRGPYCGAIGLLTPERVCLNIAIRTMLMEPGRVDFSVGGGIVADSEPAMEYQETLDKAQAMLLSLSLDGSTLIPQAEG